MSSGHANDIGAHAEINEECGVRTSLREQCTWSSTEERKRKGNRLREEGGTAEGPMAFIICFASLRSPEDPDGGHPKDMARLRVTGRPLGVGRTAASRPGSKENGAATDLPGLQSRSTLLARHQSQPTSCCLIGYIAPPTLSLDMQKIAPSAEVRPTLRFLLSWLSLVYGARGSVAPERKDPKGRVEVARH